MIAAILSALASSAGLIIDKIILGRERVGLKVYLPILFIFLFGLTAILIPFLGSADWQLAFLTTNMFMLFLMIIVAIAWNVLFYQSVQSEKIHQHEIIVMTSPLITTLLAAAFYPEEFQMSIFVITLIASLALIIAKFDRNHLDFSPVSYNLILAVVLMSTENILIRELLYTYTPVALYAVRTFFIALFFMAYFRPRYKQVSPSHWRIISISALIGVVMMVSKFYAFSEVGIIMTTLFTILGPIIVFLASWEILHEKIRPRVLVAFVVIALCLALATMMSI